MKQAIANSNEEISIILIENGAELKGHAYLHQATMNKNMNIMSLLLLSGVDVNSPGRDGQTPLHYAAGGVNVDLNIIKYLLSNGADINVKDRLGRTPLYIAIYEPSVNGRLVNKELIDFLVKNGADPYIPDNDGVTPMRRAKKGDVQKILRQKNNDE